MKKISLFVIVAAVTMITLMGCSMHWTKGINEELKPAELYVSYGVKPANLKALSRCPLPPTINIVNVETREENYFFFSGYDSINPKELTSVIVEYLKYGFEESQIKVDSNSSKTIYVSFKDINGLPVWLSLKFVEGNIKMKVDIPETKYSNIYEAKDKALISVSKALAYAAHGVTRQIIDDPVIQDYILCKSEYTDKLVTTAPLEDTKVKGQDEILSASPISSSVTKEVSTKADTQPTAVSPVPSGVAKEASADQKIQPTTILPIEEKKLKDQTKEIYPTVPPNIIKKGKYAIQIIAYPGARKNDAMVFAKNLRTTQPDVYVERVNIRKRGVWYRILMGHFTSIEDATNYMKEKKILEVHPGSFVQKI